ncbi:MAG TPA: M14 metallopeptidase family protein [Vicinamibacterales bacterium]|nr:M14 metallopeptidase family protein [Vicinamibacterales bacterium]
MRLRSCSGALAGAIVISACAARTGPATAPDAGYTASLGAAWDAGHVSPSSSPMVDHAEVERRLKALPADLFAVREAGRSTEGRAIYHVQAGRGPMPVLLWSQMHGDEPTATSALLDVFAYLDRHRGEPHVARMLRQLTLHVVPMLNPDGAERFQRRNAQGIDINRDALALVTPEGRLLKQLRDEFEPAVGFNLHNQSWRTAVGSPPRPASLSLLAVAYDEARSVNAGRLLTKKLAAVVRDAVEPIAGDRIGKYDDRFEERAFGDNITLWGTPVLLIETGPWPAVNPDPPLVRMTFVAILAALDALASGAVHHADPERYDTLPVNESGLAHTLIRGGQVLRGDGTAPFRADVALTMQRRVRLDEGRRDIVFTSTIDDLGDLRNTAALFTVDATGWLIAPFIWPPVVPGQEVTLPPWSAGEPAASLVQPGSTGGVMVIRPLGGNRYCVEHVVPGVITMRTSR